MIDHFLRWQRETRSKVTLALLGRGTMTFSENAHVRLMGVVPEAESRLGMRLPEAGEIVILPGEDS